MTRTPSETLAFNEGVEAAAKRIQEIYHRPGTTMGKIVAYVNMLTLPIPAAAPAAPEAEGLVERLSTLVVPLLLPLDIRLGETAYLTTVGSDQLGPNLAKRFIAAVESAGYAIVAATALQSAAAREAKLRDLLNESNAILKIHGYKTFCQRIDAALAEGEKR